MSKIKVTEEFEVESDDGKVKVSLKKEDGEFKYIYLSSRTGSGAILYKKPKELIKILEELEKEATSL